MDLAFTCPTCSWIFVTEVPVLVPGHPDCLLGRRCTGVGASVSCVDVRPEWQRASQEAQDGALAGGLQALAAHGFAALGGDAAAPGEAAA